MEFRILGPLEVVDEGRRIAIPARLSRALLACLLLHANEPVSADRLIDDLWGGQPPRTAAASLQNHVSRLRKALGQERIGHEPAGYLLRVDADHFDLARFNRLVDEAGASPAAERARLLRSALALWRGPPLEDLAFEEFAQGEIAHLNEQRLTAIEARIDADLALGRGAELVEELQALISAHPLRERLRGQQMLALYRAGRQADALAAYGEARRVLRDDLGLEPCEQLRKLERRILEQDPTLEGHPTNLPVQPTPLIGRELELRELRGLLLREDVRLLTLTGTGGIGKTRLALQVAVNLLADYPSGVFLVSLAATTESDLLVPAIAQELSVQARGAEPLIETLREYLRDKQMLLLLDNFEQISAAASTVGSLLSSASGLTVLVTSRVPLHVTGERMYPVPPLALPDPEKLPDLPIVSQYDGVALFVDRAQAAKPAFMLTRQNALQVAEICDRLDGLPLALELAAARIRVLPPNTLLRRLDQRLKLLTGGAQDLDPRQRTLRATIEWSYELLSDEEKTLFSRLAIFVGGCRLDAADAVCEPDGEPGRDILDGLTALVEKSLLQEKEDADGEPRFLMLETIREFAVERLEKSGEAENLRRRHGDHFLALAEEAAPNLFASRKEWLERLEGDHDNLRAALDRLDASGDSERAVRLAAALWRFWYQRGHLAEGRRRLDRALRADGRPSAARATLLDGAAQLALEGGDAATARLRAEQGIALHRELGDAWGTAHSVLLLGNVVAEEGDMPAAQLLFDETMRRFRELGDEHYTLLATRNLAWACNTLGESERARALYEEVLLRARALPNERIEAMSLGGLATIAIDKGKAQDALTMLKASLRITRDLGELYQTAMNLRRLAGALDLEGRAQAAALVLSRAEALEEEIGASPRGVRDAMRTDTLTNIRTQLDQAAFAEAWEQGQALTVDEVVALAYDSSTEHAPQLGREPSR